MRPFILASLLVLAVLFVLTGIANSQDTETVSPVTFYGAPVSGASPLEVHFHLQCDDAVVNRVTTWLWEFGDGETAAEGYTTHTYEQDGTYSVSLTVTLDGKTYRSARNDYVRVGGNESAPATEEPAAQPSEPPAEPATEAATEPAPATGDGLVFIHHSCGENWLNHSLHNALVAKQYIGARNDITYGVDVESDPGRPDSLEPVPGELTDMQHWVLWFNDYFGAAQRLGSGNRIVMFKSCFPNSHIDDTGTAPGDPFSDWKTIENYKAVYRHPGGPGKTYERNGHAYRALEDVFAAHPTTLFIAVTAPPECWNDTDVDIARRARTFNSWLKGAWLTNYVQRTGLHNVAVFDWFDVLALANSDGAHANQLRADYGGRSGDSHPNDAAHARSTELFATGADNFIDRAWAAHQPDLER